MTEQLIACDCGGDCADIPQLHENDSFIKVIGLLIIKNNRFKYIIYATILAFISIILTLIQFDEIVINLLWISSAIMGLVIPFRSAIKSARKKNLTINTLLVVATVSAVLLQLYEEAVLLVIIFSMGEIIEGVLVNITERELDIFKTLVPANTTIINDEGMSLPIKSDSIIKGQRILVRTGEIIPIDGVVVDGLIELQNSHITGEAEIVTVQKNDAVFAGGIIISGSSTIIATADAGENQVDFIVKSVEEALKQKSTAEKFSQRFAKRYTPFTFVLALLVAIVMPLLTDMNFQLWIVRALVILVVSCACGLALSVPITMVAAISSAAKRGILIRGGDAIEQLSKIKTVVFDKTGTLTTGELEVIDIKLFNGENIDSEIFTLVSRSNHPVSRSIKHYLEQRGVVNGKEIISFDEIAGSGLIAKFSNFKLSLIKDSEKQYQNDIISVYGTPKTYSLLIIDEVIKGYIVLNDKIRENARETVEILKQQEIHVVMLSGDNYDVCKDVADQLDIDFHAEVKPLEKVEKIKEIQEKYGYTAMVGDGINDAAAFATSDVSFAMGQTGTQIASEVADVVLIRDNIEDISHTIIHGKYAFRIAKMNVLLALSTIFVLLSLAFIGVLTLVTGIFANEVTALLIITNGLRLLKFRDNYSTTL